MIRTPVVRWFAMVAFAIFFTGFGAVAMAVYQPHMVNARTDLYSALNELNQANTNKNGHRNNAISLVKQAIGEVNAGINYVNEH
jgi:hypothetical protein